MTSRAYRCASSSSLQALRLAALQAAQQSAAGVLAAAAEKLKPVITNNVGAADAGMLREARIEARGGVAEVVEAEAAEISWQPGAFPTGMGGREAAGGGLGQKHE